jgi:hypothetical protein
VITNDVLTLWATAMMKGEEKASLGFPGLTCLAMLHQGGMAKKLSQKRAPGLERAMQPSTTVQPIQTAAIQSPAVPSVHMHFPSPYPHITPPTSIQTSTRQPSIEADISYQSGSQATSSLPSSLSPSSPIRGADEDELFESFIDWLRPVLHINRLQLVKEGVDMIKEAGFTLQEVRQEPSLVFDRLGVKAAALLSIKKNISAFKKHYKITQAAQQLAMLSQRGGGLLGDEGEGEEEEEEEEGESQVAKGRGRYPNYRHIQDANDEEEY